ncbi:MAG: hypothetical protein DRJ56_01730 [Thermoprotei archaeon]|nr:MAG: hypothetical protein DRJ56_01730 [Thermoprotei archaeon]
MRLLKVVLLTALLVVAVSTALRVQQLLVPCVTEQVRSLVDRALGSASSGLTPQDCGSALLEPLASLVCWAVAFLAAALLVKSIVEAVLG